MSLPAELHEIERACDVLKLLANLNRLRIAVLLRAGERSVAEIEATLAIRQPSLSQQLGALREGGLITARREAKNVVYALSDDQRDRVQTVLGALFDPTPKPHPHHHRQTDFPIEAASFGWVGRAHDRQSG